jgi:hypothetical protein
MSMRGAAAGAWALIMAALLWPVSSAAAETHVYDIPFEKPVSWSGVMLPWGSDGYLDWVLADGGRPGRCLRITNALRRQAATYEIRTLMFNHEPGATAAIHLDIRAATQPAGSQFMIRYYDGYVSAEAFEKSADDPFQSFPPPSLALGDPLPKPGWQSYQFRTEPLDHTILTLAFMVSQPADPAKDEQDEFLDYYLDNLRVETTPLSHYMDPGFDWHGKGGATMTDWRWTTGGAHVDWCDFMDETEAPVGDGTIRYDLATFRDSGSRELHVKHNTAHDTANSKLGGSSTIGLVRIDPQDAPASWGVRQTFSYAAFGLKPDDAHVEVRIKYTFQQDTDMYRRARLQVGCDPRGGIVTGDALWSPEDAAANWDKGEWHYGKLAFDRPPGATAFNVFFRCRDGIVSKSGRVRATPGVGRAFADWIMLKATKK